MNGEIDVDGNRTGVRMVSKIDFTAIFQTGMSVAAISLVVMVLRLTSEMSLVEYKIDAMTQQQGQYVSKDQLEQVRVLAVNCLPRNEAESRAKMRDLVEEELKSRITTLEGRVRK